MDRYENVRVNSDALDELRRAVLLRHGMIYGNLGLEASRAIERGAKVLVAEVMRRER